MKVIEKNGKQLYEKECLNPKCNNTFITDKHTKKYCSPECRLSNNKKYKYPKYSRNANPFSPSKTTKYEPTIYICGKCGSKMVLKYTNEGHKLYLHCTKKYCTEKIDYDRLLNEGRAKDKIKRGKI